MKNLIVCAATVLTLVSSFVFSQNVFAAECVDSNGQDIFTQPEVFTALIEKSASCYEAQQMAEACAYGSSLDVSTAGTAYSVCENELKVQKPAKELTVLLSKMEETCREKYDNEQGTMYRSFSAFCQLAAIEWIVNLATPN